MITHYLKIALRNLLKYKVQSAICIVGLAIGLAFFIFGIHWLRYETSYDSFYPKANRTYMIFTQQEEGSQGETARAMSTYLRQYCPEIECATRSFHSSGLDYISENILLKAPDFLIVDSFFISIFPQKMLYGTTLQQENEIIISETMARKYWRKPQDAVGTTLKQQAPQGIRLDDPLQLHIVGVMADSPENSSFQYAGYTQHSYKEDEVYDAKNWQFQNAFVHLVLRKGVDRNTFFHRWKHSLHDIDFLKEQHFKMISLNEKHFEFASEKSFTYSSIRMFAAASLLLLCCVWFNFLNLYLNRYYQRSREMKLRKSVGANNGHLGKQLTTEILSHCIIAYLLCGCLLELFKPFFENSFLISIKGYGIWEEYGMTIVCSLIVTGLILFIPVWQFIRLSTGHSLIVKARTHRHNTFRRISLIVQLIICLFFFTSTSLLYKQLDFIRNTDPGFDTQHVIEMFINDREQKGKDMLEEIKRLPMMEYHATTSQFMVDKVIRNLTGFIEWEGQTEEEKKIQMATIAVSKNGYEIFNFRLLKGRSFTEADWQSSENMEKDIWGLSVLNKVLINEKATSVMGLADPIGKIIRIPYSFYNDNGLETHYNDYEIIGVVKDFHTQGMKCETYPSIITQAFRFLSPVNYFRTVPGSESAAIKAINQLAQKHNWEYEGYNKEPRLLDDKLKELSKSETAIFNLFSILTVICILISLFGIYSISFSTVQQRRKEIAIRRIMGASVREIMNMFFLEYTALVCLAGLVAFPIAYAVMSKWLEQYAYHIHIGIPLFALILAVIILLVLLTVVQQVYKAVGHNPAEVIKSE